MLNNFKILICCMYILQVYDLDNIYNKKIVENILYCIVCNEIYLRY